MESKNKKPAKATYDAHRFRIKTVLLGFILLIGLCHFVWKSYFPRLPQLPPKYDAAVMSALDRSGDNRTELVKALAETKPDQLPAMCDMISRMPNYDLANITAKMLLDHIECTFETNEHVPWHLKTDSKIFLDYVLPYRAACEDLENSRRAYTDMFLPEVSDCRYVRSAVTNTITALNAIARENVLESAGLYDYTALKGLKYNQRKGGWNCRGRALRAVMALRSVGIPARIAECISSHAAFLAHRSIEYYNVNWHRWMAWDCETNADGDIAFAKRIVAAEECEENCLPPYMHSDLVGKQMYDKMKCIIDTNEYPCGNLTVLVKNNGTAVSGAWVVIYRGNLIDGDIIRKCETDRSGRATFKLGCHRANAPFIMSAGKGSNLSVTSFYLKPYENRSFAMDLSRQPARFSINLKPGIQPSW